MICEGQTEVRYSGTLNSSAAVPIIQSPTLTAVTTIRTLDLLKNTRIKMQKSVEHCGMILTGEDRNTGREILYSVGGR